MLLLCHDSSYWDITLNSTLKNENYSRFWLKKIDSLMSVSYKYKSNWNLSNQLDETFIFKLFKRKQWKIINNNKTKENNTTIIKEIF